MRRKHVELALLGDPALADLVRADDSEAFAELWRRHAIAGTAAARQFSSIADPQDIVSEAYLRILRALQQGGGPHEAFRPYLYRTVRNIALDWRSRHPSVSLEEIDDLAEPGAPMDATVLDNAVTARAFDQLPERWQAVLWYLEVEGMTPSEAAPHLGLSPNSTSALAARAQEGFKSAWLQAHVNDLSVPAECRWTTARMGRYVRHGLSTRSRDRFSRHLDGCGRCALLVREIGDLRSHLASVVLPITLGAAAGSLLLGQLRDTAVTGASTITPVAVASGSTVVSGVAAAVLIASAILLASTPAGEPAASPPAAGDQDARTASPPSAPHESHEPPQESDVVTDSDPATPMATDAELPVADSAVAVDPVIVEGLPPAALPSAAAPLVDVSVSLLSGSIELDAVIDLDPATGLLVEIVPGLHLFGD